jgi:hypothetical protein
MHGQRPWGPHHATNSDRNLPISVARLGSDYRFGRFLSQYVPCMVSGLGGLTTLQTRTGICRSLWHAWGVTTASANSCPSMYHAWSAALGALNMVQTRRGISRRNPARGPRQKDVVVKWTIVPCKGERGGREGEGGKGGDERKRER